jgi:ribosomal protein L40E
MTMGLGVFLLIFAVSMPFLIGAYALSILLAAIFFLMGIFGVVAGSRIKARPIPTSQVAQSVLVEVKCKSCNALNPETSEFCARCGARL